MLGSQRLLSVNSGPAVEVVEAEATRARNYDELVHTPEERIEVVLPTLRWETNYPNAAASYEGDLATLDSEEWRVETVSDGRHFVQIGLVSREEAV